MGYTHFSTFEFANSIPSFSFTTLPFDTRIDVSCTFATPTVSLDVISLVASSCGYYSIKSSNALRSNSRCTWRHSESSRNVHNTVIRRALSPLRSCGSVTADVRGCPRGGAPLRHSIAIRDTPVAHTGGATTPLPHHST